MLSIHSVFHVGVCVASGIRVEVAKASTCTTTIGARVFVTMPVVMHDRVLAHKITVTSMLVFGVLKVLQSLSSSLLVSLVLVVAAAAAVDVDVVVAAVAVLVIVLVLVIVIVILLLRGVGGGGIVVVVAAAAVVVVGTDRNSSP